MLSAKIFIGRKGEEQEGYRFNSPPPPLAEKSDKTQWKMDGNKINLNGSHQNRREIEIIESMKVSSRNHREMKASFRNCRESENNFQKL